MGLVEDERVKAADWKVVAHADTQDARYEVDRIVAKYRKPK
jgi:hypothetical protein